MMKTFRLTSLAVATAAALGASGTAQADAFSYAVSYDNIFNLAVFSNPNVPLSQFTDFSTTSGANANLQGVPAPCVGGVCSVQTGGGLTDVQPQHGLGSDFTRANNVFTPHGINAGQNYSTSDAVVDTTALLTQTDGSIGLTGNSFTQARNISEGQRSTDAAPNNGGINGNWDANGNNASQTGFNLVVTAVGATAFGFDFRADPYMKVELGADAAAGSQAFAQLQVVFSITDSQGGTVFEWKPNGILGGTGGITGGTEYCDGDPSCLAINNNSAYSLNSILSTSTPGVPLTQDPTGDASFGQFPGTFGTYGAISGILPAGEYTINLFMNEFTQGRLNTKSVPEPGSMALLGLGLASLGWVSRRRKVG